ncbi:hypothetical protein ACA910_002291 [Epithemia clementina (nom. ined.)]
MEIISEATSLMFEQLKLVDKPTSDRNAQNLLQTLDGCVGCLNGWPLRPANVNPKIPHTFSDMVNMLTNPEAAAVFAAAEEELQRQQQYPGQQQGQQHATSGREEGMPSAVYHYEASAVLKQLLKQAHKRTCHHKAPGIAGHVVKPGCISFYRLDGREYAVTQGRWILTNPKASWIRPRNVKLDLDVITAGNQILILRVPPGGVGCILDQGVEVLLDVGTHVFNSGMVVNAGTRLWAAHAYLSHGRYHYVRVDRGQLARVWVEVLSTDGIRSVQPRLLKEGEHFVDSHLFKFVGMSKLSDTYIEHGTVHRVMVQKGYVAKVLQDNKPRLLGEGGHIIESTDFSYKGRESIISNLCIVHETITILRVNLGQIALVWQDNEPTFYDKPGLFEFDSPDVSFVEFKDAEEQFIQLGSKKIVLCHTGQVAVTYDQGELKILPNGRHTIDSATHIFHRFLSTQQKSIRLSSLAVAEKDARLQARKRQNTNAKNSKKSQKTTRGGYDDTDDFVDTSYAAGLGGGTGVDSNSDLTICETRDLVKVGLRADVFYSIEDPEKCIRRIDTDELEDLVRETAVATLTNIVRSTTLNQIAQSKTVSARSMEILKGIDVLKPPDGMFATQGDDDAQQQGSDSNEPANSSPTAVFFEKVHDEFLALLNEDFNTRYGVDIANIRIESFKIMDEELAEQISKHALTTAQIENEMANLEGTSLISTTRERTAAEVKDISVKAEAAALKIAADAENQRQVDAAQAQAEALKIAARAKAEAEAEAILTKAKAEAEATRLKANAEAQRAQLLSQTSLGVQEALLTLYSNMVIQSNKGVEKVIYLDPSVNRDSPFALGSLANLNMDLHSLSQLGVAAAEHQSHRQQQPPQGRNNNGMIVSSGSNGEGAV